MCNITQEPLVSVIICVYNGERFLGRTIESVLAQTHQSIELIIVNDGSTDSSQSIIRGYASRDSRIRCFTRENCGLPASRNFAFKVAKGDWIAIIDQDDLCYPTRIERQLDVAKVNPTASLIFCDTHYIDEDDRIIGSHLKSFQLPDGFIPRVVAGRLLLRMGCFIDSESWFFRRDVASSLEPLIESLKYACDYEYFIRIGLCYDLAYTRENLAAWRIHPTQESATNPKRFHEHRLVLKQYFRDDRIDIFTSFIIIKNIFRSHVGEIYRWLKARLYVV